MYGDFILLEKEGQPSKRAERLAFGDTSGRNEAWLRDTLLQYPDILPIREIAPSFGPLIPLCRELRTSVGPVDAVFINRHGLLTLVECKLWRNPEARRKVVGQVLDYASAISRWAHSDLQRQVAMATGRQGNVPFELVKAVAPDVQEHQFVDATASALGQGRFLLIVAGDGIREDVESMAEFINRNMAAGFSLGLVEVALYGLEGGGIAMQPRVVAKTQTVHRTVVALREAAGPGVPAPINEELPPELQAEGAAAGEEFVESPKQAAYRKWWQPVLDIKFDDPDQESPTLHWPNNVKTPLPWPQTWLISYRYGGTDGIVGVGTGGREEALIGLFEYLGSQSQEILAELPAGTKYRKDEIKDVMTFTVRRKAAEFANNDDMHEWIKATMNTYVNVLRPRIVDVMRQQKEGG